MGVTELLSKKCDSITLHVTEAYLRLCQTTMMKLFDEICFTKSFIIDVYSFAYLFNRLFKVE